MTQQNGNDPAFPIHMGEMPGSFGASFEGLTKRELLAGLAMQPLVGHFGPGDKYEQTAGEAVKYADALLAALAKEKP